MVPESIVTVTMVMERKVSGRRSWLQDFGALVGRSMSELRGRFDSRAFSADGSSAENPRLKGARRGR